MCVCVCVCTIPSSLQTEIMHRILSAVLYCCSTHRCNVHSRRDSCCSVGGLGGGWHARVQELALKSSRTTCRAMPCHAVPCHARTLCVSHKRRRGGAEHLSPYFSLSRFAVSRSMYRTRPTASSSRASAQAGRNNRNPAGKRRGAQAPTCTFHTHTPTRKSRRDGRSKRRRRRRAQLSRGGGRGQTIFARA